MDGKSVVGGTSGIVKIRPALAAKYRSDPVHGLSTWMDVNVDGWKNQARRAVCGAAAVLSSASCGTAR